MGICFLIAFLSRVYSAVHSFCDCSVRSTLSRSLSDFLEIDLLKIVCYGLRSRVLQACFQCGVDNRVGKLLA